MCIYSMECLDGKWNWDTISQHVGVGKSPTQCYERFMLQYAMLPTVKLSPLSNVEVRIDLNISSIVNCCVLCGLESGREDAHL